MFSSSVSDTDDALAAQYNNLRLDIFDQTGGHDHDGTSSGGKKVAHGDLVDDIAIPNTYLKHTTLSKHVQAAGTSTDPDNPGGDKGVHGLAAGTFVAGALNSKFAMQGGAKAAATSGTVTFATAFSSVPFVATSVDMASGLPADQGIRIHGRTTAKFDYTCSGSLAITWIAIGTRS